MLKLIEVYTKAMRQIQYQHKESYHLSLGDFNLTSEVLLMKHRARHILLTGCDLTGLLTSST
jgi:hypothetical protein